MIDDALASALERLVRQATRKLQRASAADLPTRPGYVVQKTDRGRVRILPGEIPDWSSVTTLLDQPVREQPGWVEAVTAARADTRIHGEIVHGLVVGFGESPGYMPGTFLQDYFETRRSFRFSRRHFDRRYQEMLRLFDRSEHFQLTVVAPLRSFSSEQRTIRLGDQTITRLTPERVADIASEHQIFLAAHFGEPRSWFRSALEIPVTVPKVTGDVGIHDLDRTVNASYEHAGRINREVVLLRCFTRQVPSVPTFIYRYRGWPSYFFLGGAIIELPWSSGSVWRSESPDPLTVSEVASFRRLRKDFLAAQPDRLAVLSSAARRIALAADRPYAGDQVVDYVSAIEGLVVEEKDIEAKYRFQQRVAFLVAGHGQRRKLAQKAAKLYDIRSQVVHGGVIPDDFAFGTFFSGAGKKPRVKRAEVLGAAREGRELANSVLRKMTQRQGTAPDWDRLILGT